MIKIETSSFIPIYEQIKTEIRSRIATGSLKPDDPLPSIRDLASELIINPNTVARAYRDLEQDGLITGRRGKGSFVAPGSSSRAGKERDSLLGRILAGAVDQAVRLGFDHDEIRKSFEDRMKTLNPPVRGERE
jgi:GntR family transcriptional regulator